MTNQIARKETEVCEGVEYVSSSLTVIFLNSLTKLSYRNFTDPSEFQTKFCAMRRWLIFASVAYVTLCFTSVQSVWIHQEDFVVEKKKLCLDVSLAAMPQLTFLTLCFLCNTVQGGGFRP